MFQYKHGHATDTGAYVFTGRCRVSGGFGRNGVGTAPCPYMADLTCVRCDGRLLAHGQRCAKARVMQVQYITFHP